MKTVAVSYVLLTVAMVAMWQQGSVEGIGIVAAFIVALTALERSGFKGSTAGEPAVETEIQKTVERMEMAATSAAVDPEAPADVVETAPGRDPGQAEADRRAAVERLMKDAATWGWLKASAGSPAPPEPQIVWDEYGNAQILDDDPGALRREARRRRRRPEAVERRRRQRDAGGPPRRS
jgi:hypothetical protein